MNTPKFEFTNYDLNIEIAGKPFVLDCTSGTGDYLKAQSDVLREIAGEIGKGTKTSEDAIHLGTEIIDHILGDGATATIFGDRRIRFDDIADICVFLAQTVKDFNAEHGKAAGA